MSEPLILRLGPLQIHAYTVCMLAAVLLGGFLTYREAVRRWRLTSHTMLVGSAGVAGGVLGAKLGMVMFLGPTEFIEYLPHLPFQGATMTGALMGGYLAVVGTERALRVDRCIGDLAAPFIPLSQAVGRLGNFLAADAYGTESSVPWAVYQAGAMRHPVQIHEMALNLLLFAYLLRRRGTAFRDGELWKLYIAGYAVIRFPMEFLRFQTTPVGFWGLTLVQWLCLGVLAWFALQIWSESRRRREQSSASIAAALGAGRGRADA